MTFFNYKCKNEKNIFELSRENFVDDSFLAEGPKFLEQGRGIVDFNEALWLCQEKAKETHRPFIIHIFYDQLSIVKLLKLVRKFVIHLEPTPEFVSPRATAAEAKSMIKLMTNLHGSIRNGMVEELDKRIKTKLQLWVVEPLYWDKSLKAIQLAIN